MRNSYLYSTKTYNYEKFILHQNPRQLQANVQKITTTALCKRYCLKLKKELPNYRSSFLLGWFITIFKGNRPVKN